MAKCKNCIHNEVCDQSSRMMWAAMEGKTECDDFKDRSKYVVREKGEWEGTSCSRCGGSYIDYADADSYPAIGEPKPDFCPNCGSDMRKGENG